VITDDPLRDVEHQLVAAATRERAPHPTPPRRRARRRTLALLAAGTLAVSAIVLIVLIVLLRTGATAPSLAQAAYAQLNPKDGIITLRYDTRFLDGGHLYQHARAEISYTSTQERSVATSIGPRSGRAVRFLEVVRTARDIRSYESGARTLTVQANCQRSGALPRATTVDPIAQFKSLYQRHRISQRGTTIFDGRHVSRLVANEAGQQFVYLVNPKTGELVAMTLRPLANIVTGAPFTGSIVRFTSYRRLPLDPASRTRLEMRPHPGAKTIQLGRSRCPHR
jgi:hypothetical protein